MIVATIRPVGTAFVVSMGENTALAKVFADQAKAEREATEAAGVDIVADATAAGAAQVALAAAQVTLAEGQVTLATAEADRAEAAAEQLQPAEIIDQPTATIRDNADSAVMRVTAGEIDHPAIEALVTDTHRALSASRPLRAPGIAYPFTIPLTGVTHFIKNGQSNSNNTADPLGTGFFPGAWTFNGGVDSRRAFDPSATAATTGVNRTSMVPLQELGRESGMGAALEMFIQLVREENGIDLLQSDQRLLGSAVGVGGEPIQRIAGTFYHRYGEDVAAGYALAEELARAYSVGGIFYNGHESNQANTPPTLAGGAVATTIANFMAVLREFQVKMQTDAQAVSGQSWPVPLYLVQTNTHFSTASANYTNPNGYVARAQLAAGVNADNVNPHIVFCGPSYQFPLISDGVHFSGEGGDLRDALLGIAAKRVMFDRVKPKPLVPVATRHKSFIRLTFDTGPFQLQWDTTAVPEQTNYGFRVFNGPIGSGTQETITSVRIAGPNVVEIGLANVPAAGWEVDYAIATSTGGSRGLGNLRDNQGDRIIYAPDRFNAPMHNWVPAQRIIAA